MLVKQIKRKYAIQKIALIIEDPNQPLLEEKLAKLGEIEVLIYLNLYLKIIQRLV